MSWELKRDFQVEYISRTYRDKTDADNLIKYEVIVEETNLLVLSSVDLKKEVDFLVRKYRKQIEEYILSYPEFKETLSPCSVLPSAPKIIKEMARAGERVGVGPMAAVAGAISEFVGKDLLKYTDEVIIENGGDIFLKVKKKRYCGIFAGESSLSDKFAIEILPQDTPCGICTSSGKVGPSLSFGCADAVVVVSKSTLLADACATAVGNIIKSKDDIEKGINFAKNIKGIKGTVIICDDKIGIWGDIKLIKL